MESTWAVLKDEMGYWKVDVLVWTMAFLQAA